MTRHLSTRSATRILIGILVALLAACGDSPPPDQAVDDTASEAPSPAALDPRADAPPGGLPVVEFTIREHGRFRVELFPHIAPKTVENLIRLAGEGFYEGTTFHRVISDFMIQGGDPLSRDRDPRNDGRGDPGYTLPDEFSALAHRRGRLSMANKGAPDSGGCQFFITVADRFELDGKYTVFGEVIEGMDVVDAIAAVETDVYGRWGPRDRPREDVVIEAIAVIEANTPAS